VGYTLTTVLITPHYSRIIINVVIMQLSHR